ENQYVVAATVAFWIGLSSIAVFIFGRRRARSAIALSILSLSIVAIAVLASYQLGHGKNGRGLAIVTGQNVEARLATADNANRVLTYRPGAKSKSSASAAIGYTRRCRVICTAGCRRIAPRKCASKIRSFLRRSWTAATVFIMKAEMDVGTNRKAIQINLDHQKYGTLAEIGAGQEVACSFLHVAGAAGP